ncbi:MAG: alpha/beta fold hydrolase [Bacillaceae bacterium]
MNHPIQQTTPINGINVYHELFHYNEEKPQRALVLIHGFLSSSFSFRKLIPLLTTDYTILTIDLPPFGKSEKTKRFTYSYENFAKIVISLIETYKLKDVTLIGHSMGGQISLYVSKLKPSLIKKQILLCSSCYLYRAKPFFIWTSYLPFFPFYLKKYFIRRGIADNLLNVIYDQTLIDDEMMNGYMEPFFDSNIFHALTKMIRDREGDLKEEDVRKIEVPTLLIWGDEDKIIPIHVGQRLHQELKNSQFITLQKTGHLLLEERPQDIANYILNYC